MHFGVSRRGHRFSGWAGDRRPLLRHLGGGCVEAWSSLGLDARALLRVVRHEHRAADGLDCPSALAGFVERLSGAEEAQQLHPSLTRYDPRDTPPIPHLLPPPLGRAPPSFS